MSETSPYSRAPVQREGVMREHRLMIEPTILQRHRKDLEIAADTGKHPRDHASFADHRVASGTDIVTP